MQYLVVSKLTTTSFAAADLYLIIFDAALSNSGTAGHGTEGYYFVENFEYSGLEVAQAISETLVELGIATTREPSAFSQEELDTYYGVCTILSFILWMLEWIVNCS